MKKFLLILCAIIASMNMQAQEYRFDLDFYAKDRNQNQVLDQGELEQLSPGSFLKFEILEPYTMCKVLIKKVTREGSEKITGFFSDVELKRKDNKLILFDNEEEEIIFVYDKENKYVSYHKDE